MTRDSERLDLVPQRLAPALEGEFRSAIGTEPANRDEAADAGELQDAPASLRPHRRQHRPGHLGRGEEIDLHLLAQLVGRELLGRAERAASGDVGERVNPAEPVERGFDGA